MPPAITGIAAEADTTICLEDQCSAIPHAVNYRARAAESPAITER
jgi:hypothetical protein